MAHCATSPDERMGAANPQHLVPHYDFPDVDDKGGARTRAAATAVYRVKNGDHNFSRQFAVHAARRFSSARGEFGGDLLAWCFPP